MEDGSRGEVVRWQAVEPELTHFHDIISLDFDLGSNRGASDTLTQVSLPPEKGQSWPWQRVILTFWGGPLDPEHRQAVPVRCTFDGVVYLQFLQDDAHPAFSDEDQQDLHAVSGLRGVPGYSQRFLSHDDSAGGAFCLWESKDSPLLRRVVERAGRYCAISETGPCLRHFKTSCDELGSFEIVAGDVTVERVEDAPA